MSIKYFACYSLLCILHFALLSCSRFTIKDFLQETSPDPKFLLTADLNYQRNYNTNDELTPPLSVKWVKKVHSLPVHGFIILNDIIIFSDSKGKINFILSENGEEIGTYKTKGKSSVPPTVAQNILYQSCETGKYGLIAYDLNTGKTQWRIKKKFSRSSPVYCDNRIFHQTISGEIFCYNFYTGEEIWKISLSSPVQNSLSIMENVLYSANLDGKIFALENTSGIILWTKFIKGAIEANPVIEGKELYIASYNGNLYIIDLKSARITDQIYFNTPLYYGPAVDDQNIYMALSNGQVIALKKSTREEIWIFSGDGPTAGPPLVTNSYLYFTTLAKKLYILDKTNGKLLQQIDLKGRARSTPVIHKGKLVIACEKKQVIVFEEEKNLQPQKTREEESIFHQE